MKKANLTIILVIVNCILLISPAVNVYNNYTQKGSLVTVEEKNDPMVGLINSERAKFNLTKLKENPMLDKSATAKACDMNEHNYFSHTDDTGQLSWHLMTEAGYKIETVGENLAKDYTDDTKAMIDLMNSPTHKANLTDPRFSEVGIGRCGHYIVQHFGSNK